MSDKQIRNVAELLPEKQGQSELFIKLTEMVNYETEKFAQAIIDVAGKYTDPASVSKEVVIEVFRENGLPSVVDILEEISVVDHGTVLAFSAYILMFKGSRSGYETVLRLLGFDYTLIEWWENGGTGKPNTISIDVNLDTSIVARPYLTFQKIKKFTAEYVFPIIDPLGFTITVNMGSAAWLHFGMAHPTYVSSLTTTNELYLDMGLVESTLKIPDELLYSDTNFIVSGDDSRTWNVKVNNNGVFKPFLQDNAQETERFAVQRTDGAFVEVRITALGELYMTPLVGAYPPDPSFYLVSPYGDKWTFDIQPDNTILTKLAVASLFITATPNRVVLNWLNPYGSSTYNVFKSTDGIAFERIAEAVTSNTLTDGTVNNGVTYYYRLNSVVDPRETILKLVKPISFCLNSAFVLGSNSVRVFWDGATGADAYRIQAINSLGVIEVTQDVDGSLRQYDLGGLQAGSNYNIRITGMNAVGDGTLIILGDNAIVTAPVAPTALNYDITSADTNIKMSWPASPTATLYSIFRQVSSGSYVEYATTTATFFTDANIQYGVTNSYKVRAFNGSYSDFSPLLDVRQPGQFSISVLNAVDDSTIFMTYGSSLLANSYNILYKKLADANYTSQVTTSPSDFIASLASYTTYQVKIESTTVFGGITRKTFTPVLTAKTYVKAITDLSLIVNEDDLKIELSWTSAFGAVNYKIYRSTDGTNFTLVGTTTNTFHDSAISSNVTYYYYVIAVDAEARSSAQSNTVSGYYFKKVTDLASTLNAVNSEIALTWTPIAGATSYKIYRSTVSSTSLTLYQNVTTAGYTDTNLVSGETHWYHVVAVNSSGKNTPKSNQVNQYFLESVRNLTTTLDEVNDTITLNWSAIFGADSYKVYESVDGVSYTQVATPTAITFTDVTLQSGVSNFYYVVAVDGVLTSINGNISSKYFLDNVETLIATIDKVFATVSLSWQAVDGATSYKIFRSTTSSVSGYILYATTSTLSFEDTTLESGKTHYYKLITVSGANESIASNLVNKFYIAPVTGLTRTLDPAAQTIALNWNAVGGADNYKIYRSTSNSGSMTFYANAASNTFLDTTLTSNKTHYYYVVACQGAEVSLNSSTVSIYFLGHATDLAAIVDAPNAKIDLTWSAVGGATSYNIMRSVSSGISGFVLYASSISNSFSDITLESGETHWYKVVTVSGSNLSADSNTASGYFLAAVYNLSTVLDEANDKITLGWDVTIGAESYEIYRSITGTGNLALYGTSLTNSFEDTALSSGDTHDYQVRAVDGLNYGLYSNISSKYFLDNVEDLGIVVDNSASTIDLTWSAVQAVANYNVYRSDLDDTSGFVFQATVTGTSYQDTALVDGTIYWYHIINESISAQVSIKSNTVTGMYDAP